MKELVLKKLEKLEKIINDNEELIGSEYIRLKDSFSLTNSKEFNEDIEKMAEKDRALKIGIVGRVKAGKSSLLNSLFFEGKDVLPKAATPMTAALTIIKYSETFKAEVNFYSHEDINNIKSEAQKYEEEYNRIFPKYYSEAKIKGKEEEKSKEYAKKKAIEDMKKYLILTSSYEQYQQMENQKEILEKFANNNIENKTLEVTSSEELKNIIEDYVGVNGKYMPFTKSITVGLPIERLKDIEIIDTPGVNDPVQSRERRTRNLLKECDVTLVVSPSGQFLSDDDRKLMNRISNKEGINDIYIIASQIDNVLISKESEKFEKDIEKFLEYIIQKLTQQMRGVVDKIDEKNGTKIFEKIKREKVLTTSGLSYTIAKKIENSEKSDFESYELKIYENFKENYPNYFKSKEEELKLFYGLANVDKVHNKLNDIKNKKAKILEDRISNYVNAQNNTFEKFKKEFIEEIETIKSNLSSSNIEVLKKESKELKEKKEDLIDSVEDFLEDKLKTDFYNKIEKFFEDKIEDVEKEIKAKIKKSEGTTEVVKKGLINKVLNYSYGGGTEVVSSFNAGIMTESLKDTLKYIDSNIKNEIESIIDNFKRVLQEQLLKQILVVIDANNRQIIREFKKIIKNQKIDNISLNFKLKEKYDNNGVFTDIEEIRGLKSRYEYFPKDIKIELEEKFKIYYKNLKEVVTPNNILSSILTEIDENLDKIIYEIENKEKYIKKYGNLIKELEKI